MQCKPECIPCVVQIEFNLTLECLALLGFVLRDVVSRDFLALEDLGLRQRAKGNGWPWK